MRLAKNEGLLVEPKDYLETKENNPDLTVAEMIGLPEEQRRIIRKRRCSLLKSASKILQNPRPFEPTSFYTPHLDLLCCFNLLSKLFVQPM